MPPNFHPSTIVPLVTTLRSGERRMNIKILLNKKKTLFCKNHDETFSLEKNCQTESLKIVFAF